jgi:8-oxo-dGTP diphosphatase
MVSLKQVRTCNLFNVHEELNIMGKIIVCVKSLIECNGKLLILRRSKSSEFDANAWDLVGGKLEFGEDLHEGLSREIREETDLEVTIEKLLCATSFKMTSELQGVGLLYLSHTKHDKIKLSLEHQDYMWANRKQFTDMLHKPMLDDIEKYSVLDSIGIL